MTQHKEVKKVWGKEVWIVNRDYCGKKLVLNKGFRCSMHYHKNKDETFYINKGKVLMEIDDEKRVMKEGDSVRITQGMKHRFTGLEDSEIIEFSTHHEDSDSYRDEVSGKVDLDKLELPGKGMKCLVTGGAGFEKIQNKVLNFNLPTSASQQRVPPRHKMKVLITGGAGFIGSNLALELEKQGHSVIVVDNLLTGAKDNLKGFKGKFMKTDVSKPFEINEKIDVIFHQAAITDPRFKNDEEMIRVNLEGFKNIVELAKKNNAKLIYASTANLYGNGKTPMKEEQEKEIISAYGKTKLEMDKITETLKDKMRIVGLRYFNVFGPREANKGRAASMVYHLGKQIKDGKKPRIFKMGEQKRDHIYVKDAVNATIKAIDAKSGVYNVGTGIATDFNKLVKVLNEVLNKDLETEYFDSPYDIKTYQNNTQADTTLAEKELGFKAEYNLKDGIKDYMEWLKENE